MHIRCLIVDDNDSFLVAARLLLEREGLIVAGVASSVAEALAQAELLRPDVALVDVSLGKESGLEVARELQRRDPSHGPTIILISTRSEDEVADLIDRMPVAGFLSKSELSAEAIRRLADGSPG